MAKFLPGPTVAAVSGSIGGTTYSRNRYGAYMRFRAKPVVSTTEKAIAAKARMTAATQAWQGLTDAQRDSWRSWATSNPVVGSLGMSQQLTGHAAFSGNYARMSVWGYPVLTDPPVTPAPTPLTAASVLASKTLGTADITFTATPLAANVALWIRGCYVSSAGITWVDNLYRDIASSGLAAASPFDAFADIESMLGTMVIGHRLILLVYTWDTTTGLRSAPLRCEDVIV